MITCIILSAGKSERFGSPKALAPLNGSTIIKNLQETLLQTVCPKIIVVLGADAHLIQPSIFIHSRIQVVYNKSYYFGQTSSVQAGWNVTEENSAGVLLLPVDCPLIQSSSINIIIDHFINRDPDILIPTYQRKKGHPPIFNQRLKSKVLDLPTDQGLNVLFKDHPPQTLEINDKGIVTSFNTPEEFEYIQKISL